MLWIVPVLALGGGALLLSRRARALPSSPARDGDDVSRDRDREIEVPKVDVNGTLAERVELVRQVMFQVGAPPIWADTFALIARGESGGNPLRMLGIKTGAPSWAQGGGSSAVERKEAEAACDVFRSGRKHVEGCGWADELYCFGSGGDFGMLPMSGLKAFWGDPVLRCLHPWSIFDRKIGAIMAAHFARRLQLRAGYQGTVKSLRRGWGLPGGMASIPPAKEAKWRVHAQEIGLPPSILDAKLPDWKPIPASAMFAALSADPLWLKNPQHYYERQA